MIITESIPKEKFAQFHEILCKTGGRYLRPPFQRFDSIEVHYAPGDYGTQLELWYQCIKKINEVRRDQWWRCLLRRIGIHL